MELLGIGQLRSGEIVAEPVKSAAGAVMCPKGYVITAQAIERLKLAGVTVVAVENNTDNSSAIDARLAAVVDRFRDTDDPMLTHLRDIIVRTLNAARHA